MRIRKYKKKIDTKYVVLIFILAVFMIIGILSLIVKDDRKLSFAEKGIKDVGLGIQKVLYMPLRFVNHDFVEGVFFIFLIYIRL